MSYKLKPNYHFSNGSQTGINKVPDGRFIVIESFGNYNDIKWYKKVNNTGLTDTSTIDQAVAAGNLVSPIDSKRDIADSYSVTEIDSALSVKADIANVYYREETFAMIENAVAPKADSATTLFGYGIIDAYTKTEADSINSLQDDAISNKQDKFVSAPTSSVGQPGDTPGKISIDGSYIYYCTAVFDGVSDIWARTPLTLETW